MWNDITRGKHARQGLRYSSDLTDAESAVLSPHFAEPSLVGRPRKHGFRAILNAILYALRGGIGRRMLPRDFPPVSTVQRSFYAWRDGGLGLTINQMLVLQAREAVGVTPALRPVSSTVNRSKPPKVEIFAATTQVRRLRAESVIF